MVDTAVEDLREDLKWKVPIAGILYLKVGASGALDLKPSYMALRNYIRSNEKGKEVAANGYVFSGNAKTAAYAMTLEQMATCSYQRDSTSYIAALQDAVHGWRFVVTKRGYLGVVPQMAQASDVVAILKGG